MDLFGPLFKAPKGSKRRERTDSLSPISFRGRNRDFVSIVSPRFRPTEEALAKTIISILALTSLWSIQKPLKIPIWDLLRASKWTSFFTFNFLPI